jgi:hypothetical protein
MIAAILDLDKSLTPPLCMQNRYFVMRNLFGDGAHMDSTGKGRRKTLGERFHIIA